jgi:hypothetical protein
VILRNGEHWNIYSIGEVSTLSSMAAGARECE